MHVVVGKWAGVLLLFLLLRVVPRATALVGAAAVTAARLVDPNTAAGAHSLRSAARVKVIALVVASRHDAGLFNADMDAVWGTAWRRFVAALEPRGRLLLGVF